MNQYNIIWRKSTILTEEQYEACANLFNQHYGKWGAEGPEGRVGKLVTLPSKALKGYLKAPESWAALAYFNGDLIGYVFVQRLGVKEEDYITWVTQFVVHTEHRKKGLGTRLLRAVWSQSNQYAWGLVTANPFAVRALENATLRRCNLDIIKKNWSKLHDVSAPYLEYVKGATFSNSNSTAINTKFPIDHSDTNIALNNLATEWMLGGIGESEEWAAFTFREQSLRADAQEQLGKWLNDCDYTVMDAYNGMSLDERHAWTKHVGSEVEFIVKEVNPSSDDWILDVGCGTGRHSIELAKRNYNVVGIDFVSRLIEACEAGVAGNNILSDKAQFILGDIRSYKFGRQFNHAICLYDVIGSYATDDENIKIIENIFNHLKPGGFLIASVMNGDLTSSKAKHHANSDNLLDKILDLKASDIMQETGDIFNPDYYVWDDSNGVAYRKERFESEYMAPCELIVRDCRYSLNSISSIFKSIGFEILTSRVVRLGYWCSESDSSTNNGKEILLVCKKPIEII